MYYCTVLTDKIWRADNGAKHFCYNYLLFIGTQDNFHACLVTFFVLYRVNELWTMTYRESCSTAAVNPWSRADEVGRHKQIQCSNTELCKVCVRSSKVMHGHSSTSGIAYNDGMRLILQKINIYIDVIQMSPKNKIIIMNSMQSSEIIISSSKVVSTINRSSS